jgi:hypothetical protein
MLRPMVSEDLGLDDTKLPASAKQTSNQHFHKRYNAFVGQH